MRTIAILAALILSACGSRGPTLESEPEEAVPVDLKETTPEDLVPFLKNRTREYPLYTGDVIRIEIQEHPELTIERRIPTDGSIPLYALHTESADGVRSQVQVKAAGARIEELEAAVARQYAKKIPDPYVTIRVTEYAPKVIYVSGGVASPRDYPLPDDLRITLVQALTMAGWFSPVGVQESVRIFRRDTETGKQVVLPPINVRRIVSDGAVGLDIFLDPGDTVTVDSKMAGSVYIFGHVRTPGEYPYTRGMTLTGLVTLAGGLKEYPKLSNVRVIRTEKGKRSKSYSVDLGAIISGSKSDVPLKPGDRVYIEETFI